MIRSFWLVRRSTVTRLPIKVTGGDQKAYGLYSGGLSGSRLGFKGEEALGNGLKAIFVYEFGNLDPSTQNNNIGQSRNSYVGLSGGFGTIIADRLNSPDYTFAEAYNPIPDATFSSQQNISGNNSMTIIADNADRLNNTVAYISPNFSGFTGKIAYAFGEQTTGSNVPGAFDSAQGVLGLGLDYANGPLAVGLAYHNISNTGGTPNTVGARDFDQWELAIGGSYDFKIVKLFASWQNLNQDNFRTTLNATNGQVLTALANGGSVDGNLWNIAGRIPVGANGAINLAYSQYYNNISGPNNDQRVSNYGIDYEYSFSKRTTAYVGLNYMDNGNNTSYGYGATTANVKPTDDNSAYLLGAGIRHTF
ncbi:MAG: porin [Propionivibrio sp.]|uniref:Porin n=1 Tax=Candidatus Propionivibrio dominans TaxID=2954373 RepID=A0A9D7FGL6_9RHOO|nr:porin [Candidatus Propionivibrio dominans]